MGAPRCPWGPQGAPWGPLGDPWTGAPWASGPLGRPLDGRPVGPLGPLGGAWTGAPWAPWAPNPLLWVADKFETLSENRLLVSFWSKINEQKWDSGPGTPTARSGPEFCAGSWFSNPKWWDGDTFGGKKCDLGSIEVPSPASKPWAQSPVPIPPDTPPDRQGPSPPALRWGGA